MALRGHSLSIEKGGTQILQNIDFAAGDGELVGVLGPSGSGKSSLLLVLNGFWRADQGRVALEGRDLYENFESYKTRIGYVPQDDIVPTELTVERVLEYAAELRLPEFSVDERRGRVDGAINHLDLRGQRDQRVSSLSGGQRKRVSVGVELLSRPEVLFADEPTSGLDPALERSLMKTFKNLTRDGSTVVLTTHVMASLDLLDRVHLLYEGKLVYSGPIETFDEYFDVDDYGAIYTKLESKSASEWAQKFKTRGPSMTL